MISREDFIKAFNLPDDFLKQNFDVMFFKDILVPVTWDGPPPKSSNIQKAQKEYEQLSKYRVALKTKLENQGFLTKADPAIIEQETTKLKAAEKKLSLLKILI